MPPQKLHILGLDRKRGLFLLASPFKPVPGELTLWRKADTACRRAAGRQRPAAFVRFAWNPYSPLGRADSARAASPMPSMDRPDPASSPFSADSTATATPMARATHRQIRTTFS